MLNKNRHQLIMGQILKDIYKDLYLAPKLGFKGGTCAYFFYNLPRFSVNLDFDLLKSDKTTKNKVSEKILEILKKYGKIRDERVKRFTVFALLSYGEAEHNIKIEISTRGLLSNRDNYYELKEYLGIPMMAAKKEYLFTSKLIALTGRREMAMRDVYDIYFFAKNNWDVDKKLIEQRTNKNVGDYLKDCIGVIEKVKENQLLKGLGEMVEEKDKNWIKNNLKEEVLFLLENYRNLKE